MKQRTMTVFGDITTQTKMFLTDYLALDPDDEIVVLGGLGGREGETPVPALLFEFGGVQYPFLVEEARAVATVIEAALSSGPKTRKAAELFKLMNIMRISADKAETEIRTGTLQ